MEIERSLEVITISDLKELHLKSCTRLADYFIRGKGTKWQDQYDIENPLVVALCQGAAMHYYDGKNGIKDFDIWFFYPFNKKHLPYRTVWHFDYENEKFGKHPSASSYKGRKVDVIVRSIEKYNVDDPVETLLQYLQHGKTQSSKELSKKAVVIMQPESEIGRVIWYKGEKIASY